MFENLLNNHELLEKIAVTIIGGLSKDAVKDGIIQLGAASKEKLKKLILSEQEQQILLKVLDEAPHAAIISEAKLISFIKEQLSAENNRPQIKQRHSDKSPIITGGVVNDGIHYNYFQGDNVVTKIINNYQNTPKKKHLTKNPPKTEKKLIGRQDLMKEIHAMLQPGASLLVMGIGGIGKTEVCRNYFWQMENSAPHIGWINYDQGIKTDFVNQITGFGLTYDPKSTLSERFDILYSELNQLPPETILIIDNVSNRDDLDLRQLDSLPFRILVSARGPLPYPKNVMQLEFLKENDCRELFRTYYERSAQDEKVLDAIIQRAGRHTLTVELLAKTAQVERVDLADLLQNLIDEGFNLSSVIQAKVGAEWSDETPDFLFNHLKKLFDMTKLADVEKEILSKIALLAPAPMDIKMVKKILSLSSLSQLNYLIARGWLQEDRTRDTVWMHQVLQDVTRRVTKPKIESNLEFINNLSQVLDYEPNEYFFQKMGYLMHGVSVLEYFFEEKEFILAELAQNVASLTESNGSYIEALKWQKKVVEIRERVLPAEYPDLALSYNNLSLIYRDLGDYPEALKWQEKAVEISERVLPADHPSLAIAYNNLSLIYRDLGDDPEALKWQEKAVEISERVLPADHLSLAIAYNNLSLIYRDLGDYPEALKWQEKAVEISERVLPADHPSLADLYNNLSLIYSNLGDDPEALKWQEKAIEISEQVLPADHPDLALSYNNLSLIYSDLGDYPEALKWQEKAVEISERVLPADHPELANSYSNISMIYRHMRDYPEAFKWNKKAVEIRERVLPADHRDLAIAYNNLSLIYSDLGDYPEALKWQEKAVEISERVLPVDHPQLVTSYNNLSMIYRDMGDDPGALKWKKKAVEILERVLPAVHPYLADLYNNLSVIYSDMGDYPEALKWQKKIKK